SPHLVEGLELARFQQRLGGLDMGKKAADLARRGLEEVKHFPIDVEFGTRRRQHDEADQLLLSDDRHQQPARRDIEQPGWNLESRVLCRLLTILREVDYPAGALEKAPQRMARLKALLKLRQVPPRCRRVAVLGISKPKRACRAFDQVGERFDRALCGTHSGLLCGKQIG